MTSLRVSEGRLRRAQKEENAEQALLRRLRQTAGPNTV
jgi:hypothetical protein